MGSGQRTSINLDQECLEIIKDWKNVSEHIRALIKDFNNLPKCQFCLTRLTLKISPNVLECKKCKTVFTLEHRLNDIVWN